MATDTRRGLDPTGPRRVRTTASRRVLAGLLLLTAVVVAAIVYTAVGAGTPAGPPGVATPPVTASGRTGQSSQTPGSSDTAGGPSDGSPAPVPTPSGSPAPLGEVAIVPIADYRSTADSIGRADLSAVIHGSDARWHSLELVSDQADAVLTTLGLTRSSAGARLVLAESAAALTTDLAAHRDRLGFMRADQVGPDVTALAWEQQSLFGVHHLKSLAAWPLKATLPTTLGGVNAFDPGVTWTLFAGGDIGLDRSIYSWAIQLHRGVDYPYSGGTARVTGLRCCSRLGQQVPVIEATGGAGAMRNLISSADLALANMEESAPNNWTFHGSGTVLTGDPALLAGVANAGIDVVSAAATHIGDGGPHAIAETLQNLTKYGLKYFGAGANLSAARRPALFDLGGAKVAILGYDGISGKFYGATAHSPGDSPLVPAHVKEDIAAARAQGADLVIVYPHWGVEYTRGPSSEQMALGHMMVDAGADIVIGNHPHWAQAMEVYKGRPIWYALGNFTYDQSWSEPTLEGITLELTFRGARLVQARMHPHILILAVQPNLLDPAGDGQRVLGPIYKASGQLLPW